MFKTSAILQLAICSLKRLAITLALCSTVAATAGADMRAWDTLTTPSFSHLTMERELPNAPGTLAQDASGFVWIGTQGGLVRWDGYRSRVFRHDAKDPHSLPDDYVRQLVVSRRGVLYVATNAQVSRYDPDSENFVPLPMLQGDSLESLAVDGAEGLWIGNAEGLWSLAASATSWRQIDLGDLRDVHTLLSSQDGALWVGIDGGLWVRPRPDARFTPTHGIAETGTVSALAESADGRIWVGRSDGEVFVIAKDRTTRQASMPSSNALVASIVPIGAATICVSLVGQGLVYLDASTLEVVRTVRADPARRDGLSSDNIEVSMADRDGGLWVAHDLGVDYARGGTGAFSTVTSSALNRTVLTGSNVTAVLALDPHHVWVGSDGGSDLIDPASGKLMSLPRGPSGNGALPIAWIKDFAATRDRLWIATHGLFELNAGKIKRFEPLADQGVFSLQADDEYLWVGLKHAGLARISLHDDSMLRYRHTENDAGSISDDVVQAILVDRPRGVWVATTRGLDLLNPQTGRFQRFMHVVGDPSSLPDDNTDCLYLDAEHRLWVGMLGGGVAVLLDPNARQPRFRSIGRSEGLPDMNVDKLLADRHGRVWVSTDHGVAMIDPTSFGVHAFGAADGVSISAHWSNSGATMVDGTLVFGGVGGMTIIHPDRMLESAIDPPLRITSVKRGSIGLPPTSLVRLGPHDRNLQIEFAALDYTAPRTLEYAYQMVGIDDHWITTDASHRYAAYTNLEPGQYRLLLKNTNRLGQWSSRQSAITIDVTPRWYQTWWSKLLALGFGVLAIYGIVQGRTALLLRQRRELEARVAERTRELERAKEALEQLATQDGLTKIGNRRRFDMVLDKELRRVIRTGEPLSLLLIDVDDFKAYNDAYGHQAGDDVLRQVARLCESVLQRGSDVAARYGGEEFAVILPGVDLSGALQVARAVNAAVAGANIEHGHARAAAYVTVSIGVAVTTDLQSVGKQALIAAADGALYTAKHLGRNRAQPAPSQQRGDSGVGFDESETHAA